MKFTEDTAVEYRTQWGSIEKLYFHLAIYDYDKSIGVITTTYNDLYHMDEPFGNVTVCLDCHPKKNRAYIDINNLPGIDELLIKNGIAKPTGNVRQSGFVSYPEFEFSTSFLRGISEDVYNRYLTINGWK